MAFRVGNYDNTAEREQFRCLCEQLKAHYAKLDDFCVFAGNYNIGCELDALFIKKDAIIAIEFKNYGGHVIASENGEWTSNGQIIKGGSRKSVLQQARINHSILKKELKALGVETNNVLHVPTLIVFNQSIELENNLCATTKSWLHITDNDHFIEKIDDITCPKTDLSPLGIVNLAELLHLNSFYLKEFSNANCDDKPKEDNNPKSHSSLIEDTTGPSSLVTVLGNNSVLLPEWLDKFLFEELGAKYSCAKKDLVVLNWNASEILSYLGTYFPRSFAESYTILKNNILSQKDYLEDKRTVSIFDFGCGTGGELVGSILALKESFPSIETIYVKALDGNSYSLRILEALLSRLSQVISVEIIFSPLPIVIDDIYDFGVVAKTLSNPFDYIITFKSICEFVKKQEFDSFNPYEYILNTLIEKIYDGGCVFLADITSYSEETQEWLPKIIDKGIANSKLTLIASNKGYNEEFLVSHSHKRNDNSKIAWRILRNR